MRTVQFGSLRDGNVATVKLPRDNGRRDEVTVQTAKQLLLVDAYRQGNDRNKVEVANTGLVIVRRQGAMGPKRHETVQ